VRQDTLNDSGFEKYRKKTRRQQFLEDMEKIIPWDELCSVIAPFTQRLRAPADVRLGLIWGASQSPMKPPY
jgi:hypothetical protein